MLACSPPFPLIINFIHIRHDRDITAEDEKGMVFALQQRNRVRHIRFRMGVRNLQRVIMAIDDEYPMLESLVVLHPTRDNSANWILPLSFRAPHLRRLVLSGVAFPTKSPLLTTVMSRLVTLRLYFIHQSAYVRPNVLFQSLSIMPQLETVVIGFLFPVPNRDVERELLLTPIRSHITLPNLRYFTFQGASSYLEALVRWATTPRLEKLGVVFSNELIFSLPYLLQFIIATESLKFHCALIEFSSASTRVGLYSPEDRENWAFRIDVDCEQFDWQLSSMAQIFSALRNAFSEVEHLILGVGSGNLSPDLEKGHHEIDCIEWRRLLSSFGNVKAIFVHSPLVAEVSRCLRWEDGKLLELLPELQELIYPGIDDEIPFKPFIYSRRNTGRPVTLVHHAKAQVPSMMSSMSPRPPTEFVKSYSVELAQSDNSPYPGDFERQQNPRPMTLVEPSSQASAGAWNPLSGLNSHQSTSESRSPYNPSDFPYPLGFVRQQNPRPMTLAEPSSQASAGEWDPWARSSLHQSTSESRSPYNPSDSPYPLHFARQQNPRQMTLAEPSTQASAGTWNPLAESNLHQSTSESHLPYNPGGFRVARQQSAQPIATVPLSQGPAGVRNAWLPSSQARWPLPEDNWTIMAAKKRKALVVCNGQQNKEHAY